MYHQHFGLAAEPFSLTPDPAFLFLGRQHREALAAVEYGIREGRGFITVVGEVGTGKTTLLYALLSRLNGEASTAFVSFPTRDVVDVLRCAMKDFGIEAPPAAGDRVALLQALNAHLLRMADAGRPTALVIDEAQTLSDETFEELRMLSNFETFTRKLIQIVLVGQPELEARLAQPRLRQLRERISVHATLGALDREEMLGYIGHRLALVGGSLDVFERRALRQIVRRAAGIPRRANILCHNALLFAYGRQLHRVTPRVVREAVREIGGRHTSRPWLPQPRWLAALGGGALAAVAAVTVLGAQVHGLRRPPVASASPLGDPLPAPTTAVRAGEPRLEPERTVSAGEPGDGAAGIRTDDTADTPQAADGGAKPDAATAPATADAPAAPAAQPAPAAPVAATTDDPPTVAAAPAPAAAAAAGADAEPVEVYVPEGATLLHLARELYGTAPDARDHEAFFTAVRRLNPSLRSVDVIKTGDRLLLPARAGRGVAARTPVRG